MTNTIGILLFSDAEELDFVGPYEVLGMFAKHIDKDWQVVTVAQRSEPVLCAKGLRVVPDCTFEDCPPLDIVLIPGGFGTRTEENNATLLDFVRREAARCRWVTSVCTGAFILRKAGLLAGRRATTHWASMKDLREDPEIEVVEERFVEDGKVITAAGVSAGIDMALYLVGKIRDPQTARTVQKLMEYYPEPPFAEAAAVSAGKGTN
jgi:transcriptional regulator GlxA family with amidase domain